MSNELAYALKWTPWADTGFSKEKYPTKNPYERKKHRPKLEVESEARKLLGLKIE